MRKTSIMVLDEPVTSIDAETQAEVSDDYVRLY
jgi:ABC-type cobalamin/Fe3+-siderophores transport system ATPase subunit